MENKKKILIVEDEISLNKVLSDKFKHEHFEVFEAKNGEEGLIMALREHPDLILLDLIMPVMDGMTMLAQLREDSWGRDAQVILLTNLSESEKISQAIELGSYDYLVKSDWKIEDVVLKIKEKLKITN